MMTNTCLQLQLQSVSVSKISKWNFHVKSVASAHYVVQQLCHERVFLRLGHVRVHERVFLRLGHVRVHERVFLRLGHVHVHLSTRGPFANNITEHEHAF